MSDSVDRIPALEPEDDTLFTVLAVVHRVTDPQVLAGLRKLVPGLDSESLSDVRARLTEASELLVGRGLGVEDVEELRLRAKTLGVGIRVVPEDDPEQ